MDEENESYQKLKDYSFRLISIRPRSTPELSAKLLIYCNKKSIPSKYIHTLVKELTDRKYLNDFEFATWWKEQRESHNPKGERVIKMELQQKGVPSDIISELFSGKHKERTNGEFEKAIRVATKKMRVYKNLDKKMVKIKLGNTLARRGFDWDTISKVIDSLTKKEYNTKVPENGMM